MKIRQSAVIEGVLFVCYCVFFVFELLLLLLLLLVVVVVMSWWW